MDINQYQLSLKSLKHEIDNLKNVNQAIRKLSHTLSPVMFSGQSFSSLIESKIIELFPKNTNVAIQCLPEEELDKHSRNSKI